ncbi:hypothetical protein [Helicobacter trogontum]|uniref:hypothetical protein n=1 Tax=Helicobacter trogontum TaxID=50960 RepID=UPI000CF16497|nr:hypothetical protein [Helicobacter trogontum]
MKKDIRTHEADINLVKKFLDYAECADASYASLKYALYLIFGIFVIALLNGCSFKYIDPQYYEFKRLCKKEAQGIILNNILFNLYLKAKQKISFYNGIKFYDEITKQEFLVDNFELKSRKNRDISNRLREFKNVYYYKNEPFYEFLSFSYNYKGLFLKGDEAAEWHWENERALYCKDHIIETRR